MEPLMLHSILFKQVFSTQFVLVCSLSQGAKRRDKSLKLKRTGASSRAFSSSDKAIECRAGRLSKK
jgi:hypothetical protein